MQLDQMDFMLMEALADLNKAPANMERSELDKIVNDWEQYSGLVSWAASELQVVAQTEEAVRPIQAPEDLPDFQMEFSGLLKELRCPYNKIMDQTIGNRFDTMEKKKVVLNFVLSELQAARILHVHSTKPKQLKVELDESGTAKILREISMELGLGKPPESITVPALWNNINGKVGGLLKNAGEIDPLFEGFLSPSQWSQIEKYFGELAADYQKRREMLVKRLDVTVQSFHWGDKFKGKKDKEIDDKFQKFRPTMESVPNVKVSDILAARIDLPILDKTSAASVRKNTKSAVNSVVIGRVPDRGGRTDEIRPPPPEMPPWQQRQGGAPAGSSGWIQGGQQPRGGRGGGGGGGHRGGGGGGGRVQGGWSDSGQRGGGGGGRQQNNYNNQQQYDNRNAGGGYNNQQQQQYDNRGGGYHQQQQAGGGGGGYYQHDNRDRGGGGGHYQDQQQGQGHYQQQQHGGGYGDQGGGRDNRYDDSRGGGGYRGGRGGRGGGGGGRRY